jgi:hypothetical protein
MPRGLAFFPWLKRKISKDILGYMTSGHTKKVLQRLPSLPSNKQMNMGGIDGFLINGNLKPTSSFP